MAEPTSKRCCDCRTIKPLSEFHGRRVHGSGGPPKTPVGSVQSRCKRCSNRKRVRDRWQRNAGVSARDYLGMVTDQCGTCAICGETETASGRTNSIASPRVTRRLNVDHDHVTGQLRALLCLRCNITLGLVRDDSVLLRRIIAYLEEWGHS